MAMTTLYSKVLNKSLQKQQKQLPRCSSYFFRSKKYVPHYVTRHIWQNSAWM